MSSAQVGLIGVGLLGTALAERFRESDFAVCGYDRDTARLQHLESLGGTAVDSAAQVARQCKRIVLSLPDSTVVSQLLDELVPHLADTEVILDTTTGAPADAERAASQLGKHNVAYLDTTVAGSSHQTRQGKALLLVGGSAVDYAANADLFDALTTDRFHVGPVGSGAKMKLVVNLAIGLNRAVLAESLAFGTEFGFDPATVLQVLRASPGHSHMMDTKGQKMVEREFDPQARLRQHLKDVRLILASATQTGAKIPLSTLHAEILQFLVEAGFGDEDNSAVIRYFQPE